MTVSAREEIRDANNRAGFLIMMNNCFYETPLSWNRIVMRVCTYCVTAINCNSIPEYRASANKHEREREREYIGGKVGNFAYENASARMFDVKTRFEGEGGGNNDLSRPNFAYYNYED